MTQTQKKTARPTAAASSDGIDPMRTVSIVGNECRPAGTGGGATVAMPTARPPISSDGNGRADADGGPVADVHQYQTSVCPVCGGAFVARRPWSRYCTARCRRVAWIERNPERAAELAQKDKQRLRTHIEGRGGVWVD